MLRTIFIVCIASYGFYYAVRAPFFALLLYLWIAYFRPEQWVWTSVIADLNLSLVVGIFLVVSTILRGTSFRFDLRALVLFGLLAQGLISTLVSGHFEYCWFYWKDVAKAFLISYLIGVLVTDLQKLRLTFIVIALSLGFEVAKQGWLEFIFNPGEKNPNFNPFLGDENGVAIGVLMLVPILAALVQTSTSKWQSRGFTLVIFGAVYRAISTYSRGAFVSSGVLAFLMFIRSKNKVRAAVAVVMVSAIVLPVLPDTFWKRMQTIAFSEDELREDDTSSRGRLHFWRVAMRMADDRPLTGVGLNGFNPSYDQYDFLNGRYGSNRAVHSMWFGILAELGYPGAVLYVLNLGLALLACRLVKKSAAARSAPELVVYAVAIETGLIVFMVGGSFLNAQYVEMLWHFVGLSAALLAIARVPAPAKDAVADSSIIATSPITPVNRVSTAPVPRAGFRPVSRIHQPLTGSPVFFPQKLDQARKHE